MHCLYGEVLGGEVGENLLVGEFVRHSAEDRTHLTLSGESVGVVCDLVAGEESSKAPEIIDRRDIDLYCYTRVGGTGVLHLFFGAQF